MIALCPECGAECAWQRVECTPAKTSRGYRCKCGKRFVVEEDPKPAAFFKVAP